MSMIRKGHASGIFSEQLSLKEERFSRRMACSSNREEMKRVWTRVFVVLAIVLAGTTTGAATEPWGDQRLPVKDGLEVWLDASRQNAARLAKQLPGLNDGRPVEGWFDGSGNQIDIVQRIPDLRT